MSEALTSKKKADEIGWLIEHRNQNPQPRWRTFDDGAWGWTTDSTKAIRFARKIDAEAFAGIDPSDVTCTEHMWCDVPALLKCQECGADRTKEPCGRSFMPGNCPMAGVAQ